MTTTVTLSENEIGEAIAMYLAKKGLRTSGTAIVLNYTPGDRPSDRAEITAKVEVTS